MMKVCKGQCFHETYHISKILYEISAHNSFTEKDLIMYFETESRLPEQYNVSLEKYGF
jgi:hypothetical protein